MPQKIIHERLELRVLAMGCYPAVVEKSKATRGQADTKKTSSALYAHDSNTASQYARHSCLATPRWGICDLRQDGWGVHKNLTEAIRDNNMRVGRSDYGRIKFKSKARRLEKGPEQEY